jgi:RNA polymerase sigma-70 factor (ECF subfamily)
MIAEERIDEFESAALPHLDELFRTASRLVGDRADASDVVQEVYFQAWKSFERFAPGTNCRAWLYKILFHVVHHHWRQAKRRNLRVAREDERGLEETVAWIPPVRQTVEDKEVLAAFHSLPPAFREVVLLVDVEELSYKEAAGALEIPIGTVMSRLSRGRKLLRERLAGYASSFGIGVAAAAPAVEWNEPAC